MTISMTLAALPDGKACDISKLTETDIGVAFVKAQTKLFSETVEDLKKLVEKNRQEHWKNMQEHIKLYKRKETHNVDLLYTILRI